MKHLLILTPSLGRVSIGYRDAFAGFVFECSHRDIKLSVCDATDPGQLVHARNVLLAAAADADGDRVFWWDADVSFKPALVFELADRPEQMICRPYPMREYDFEALADAIRDNDPDRRTWSADELRHAAQRWTTQLHFDEGKPVWSADRKLVQVDHCGFGWVLMHGHALREWVRAFEWDDPPEKDWRDRRVVRGFDLASNASDITQGEDVSFCSRWGHRIWAAPFGHVQNGAHGGTFADYLKLHGLL